MMIPPSAINTAFSIDYHGCHCVISDLQPLSVPSLFNHTQLWSGVLQSTNQLPKNVVIKQLTPNFSALNLAYLQQELNTLGQCQSLAIEASSHTSGVPTLYGSNLLANAPIFDVNQQYPYIVMSYHEGQTLTALINQSSSLTLPQKIAIFLQICQLVDRLHHLGIMHLDIKPSNVIVQHNFTIVLVDFGLSQCMTKNNLAPTHRQQTAGTPAYMSPEQLTGQALDYRSDYYSLGILLFELLTGCRPFQATDIHGWAVAHCQLPVPHLMLTGQLSEATCQTYQPLIDQLLAKHPDNRIDSLKTILGALKTLLCQ